MSPKIRVRGPRLRSQKVHVTKETDIIDNDTVERYLVQIHLSSEVLSKLSYPFTETARNENNVTPEIQVENTREASIESQDDPIPVVAPVHNQPPTVQSSSDDELSSLDDELNEILEQQARSGSSNQTTPMPSLKQEVKPEPKSEPPKPESKPKPKPKPKTKTPSVQPSDYKPIPKNILPIIQQELRHLEEDDEAMVDKMVFSLKDPLGASRIKLPVRSQQCVHFECFDYENFCIFNKITGSTRELTRKNLIKRNIERLAQERQRPVLPPPTRTLYPPKPSLQNHQPPTLPPPPNYQPYVKVIDSPYTSRFIAPVFNCPTYSCPICDTKFMLSGLTISDSYNYFVKSTPKETERIELIGMEKYRLINDSITAHIPPEDDEDMIVLSSDDEEDQRIKSEEEAAAAAAEAARIFRVATLPPQVRPLYNAVYNNYPDNVLIGRTDLLDNEEVWGTPGNNSGDYYSHGSSWEDPVVLDD